MKPRKFLFVNGLLIILWSLNIIVREKKATYDLAHANVEMLAIQEKLEAQNEEKE